MHSITTYYLLATLCIVSTHSALFQGGLRGPNVCFHYDVGRYCCQGFMERNGFCVLARPLHNSWPGRPYTPTRPTVPQRIRFAEKPNNAKVVSLTKLDKYGRPTGNAYSHGRQEERHYGPVNGKSSVSKNVGDYGAPVDMALVRKMLAEQRRKESTTPITPTTSKRPKLRFQTSAKPKPSRPWDNKDDRRVASYSSQVAVSKHGSYDIQAILEQQELAGVAEVKQKPLVVYPGAGVARETTTTLPADGTHNRKYFTSQPIKTNQGPQQQQRPANSLNCPAGYAVAYSEQDGELCYPTSSLLHSSQSVDRVPSRGDAAFQCPPHHRFQSSVHGEACVPFNWQPCSGEPGCDHSQQQPLVKPVSIISGCQSSSGQSTPCRNTSPVEVASVGCAGACSGQGCADCGVGRVSGPINCQGDNCRNSAGCDGANCFHDSACLNGATTLANGGCICKEGYLGNRCQYRARSSLVVVEDDVDECMESGVDGRGPCSYKCLNTVGSYKCLCPAGSIVAPDGVSCLAITCPKCMHGGRCDTDTNKCICPSGFTGDICEKDVNECEDSPGLCAHTCRNTFGGYVCLCNQGYTLLRDGRSCEDWRCKPNCVNGGRCIRSRCLCPLGFSGIICQFNNRL